MSLILVQEISSLQTRVVRMALVVESRLEDALAALAARDSARARTVIDRDDQIDRLEVTIEEECLKLLALHQPVASDLRWVIAVLKINNDLERIADLAVNIAERAQRLEASPPSGMEKHLQQMGAHAIAMLKRVFEGLTRSDAAAAREALLMDERMDQMHHHTLDVVEHDVAAGEMEVRALLLFLSVSRDLERVGDHATNIAEDLLYLLEGKIVRHSHPQQEPWS
jgi:phosphate transport system protein